jgi:DNA replication protein DnaC
MAEKVCERCGGTGWKIEEREGLSGAERCECVFVGRTQRIEDASGIPPLYSNASLDNFLLPKDNPTASRGLAQVMTTISSFARNFPAEGRPGLLLTGEPGSGKTHLAVAALRLLIARGFEGLFFDYQNLLDRIRSGYDPAAGSSDREAYRVALDAEVLLLDDLGAHRVTDWVEDTVTSIITHRCNHRKPLIATTNLPDPEAGDSLTGRSSAIAGKVEYRTSLAERVGERARSRLFEMCKVVRMPLVEDYRLRKVR